MESVESVGADSDTVMLIEEVVNDLPQSMKNGKSSVPWDEKKHPR